MEDESAYRSVERTRLALNGSGVAERSQEAGRVGCFSYRMMRIAPVACVVAAGFVLCGCFHPPKEIADYELQVQPLEAFLEDRRGVGKVLEEYPALEEWLRAELVRPSGSFRLAWDDGMPPGGALASHSYLKEQEFVVVRVRRDLKPADELAGLVFEICNARNYLRLHELLRGARAGRIVREDFVDEILTLELEAVGRARAVLVERMAVSAREREDLTL